MKGKTFSYVDCSAFTDVLDVRDGINPRSRLLLTALKEQLSEDRYSNSSRVLKKIFNSDGVASERSYDFLVDTTWPRCDLPLIDGHGNFGFPPAAPDFSEIKLTEFATFILEDSNTNSPDVPFSIPIPYAHACGTYNTVNNTKIPTHNLLEIIDAIIALIKNPNLETNDLLQFIKGPDLIIGGAIENADEIPSIYEKGYGNFIILITPENFDRYFIGGVNDFCNWYGLKSRKLYKKEAYRLWVPYFANMFDGDQIKLMSLKEILQKHIEYYRMCKNESDDALCAMLNRLKKGLSCRKTQEKVST